MLGTKIQALRKQKNIKQIQLAEKAGLACSTLCDIEKGRLNPSIKSLEKIAAALEVPIATFFLDSSFVDNENFANPPSRSQNAG